MTEINIYLKITTDTGAMTSDCIQRLLVLVARQFIKTHLQYINHEANYSQ